MRDRSGIWLFRRVDERRPAWVSRQGLTLPVGLAVDHGNFATSDFLATHAALPQGHRRDEFGSDRFEAMALFPNV